MFDQFPDPVQFWLHYRGQILTVAGAALTVGAGIFLLRALWQRVLRHQARSNCGVVSLTRVRVALRPSFIDPGIVHLEFPTWARPNKDGSANRRVAHNDVQWGRCTLRIGRFLFISRNPTRIYQAVREARSAGHSVEWHPLEVQKFAANQGSHLARTNSATAASIHARFGERPTDFEHFCADLFRARGLQVTVSPATQDGGYDLILNDGVSRTVAECKCFGPQVHVGRPLLQKLVGANMTIGAERTMFITTSSYSPQALNWAREVGMDLIDGNRLARLTRETWGHLPPNLDDSPGHFELTVADLKEHYPPDMR